MWVRREAAKRERYTMAGTLTDENPRRPIRAGGPADVVLRATEQKLADEREVRGLTPEEATEFRRLKAKIAAAEGEHRRRKCLAKRAG
jgi:hypothetical protein